MPAPGAGTGDRRVRGARTWKSEGGGLEARGRGPGGPVPEGPEGGVRPCPVDGPPGGSRFRTERRIARPGLDGAGHARPTGGAAGRSGGTRPRRPRAATRMPTPAKTQAGGPMARHGWAAVVLLASVLLHLVVLTAPAAQAGTAAWTAAAVDGTTPGQAPGLAGDRSPAEPERGEDDAPVRPSVARSPRTVLRAGCGPAGTGAPLPRPACAVLGEDLSCAGAAHTFRC